MKNYRVISYLFLLLIFLLTACSSSEQKNADTESSSEFEMANLDSSSVKEELSAKISKENKESDITKKPRMTGW